MRDALPEVEDVVGRGDNRLSPTANWPHGPVVAFVRRLAVEPFV